MKKFGRKLFFTACALAAVIIACLCGCTRMYGNSRDNTDYVEPEFIDGKAVYDLSTFAAVDKVLTIDRAAGTAQLSDGGTGEYAEPQYECAVAWGKDAGGPRSVDRFSEGYGNLRGLLTEKYEKGKVKLIQYYAVKYGEEVYGFCNLYSKTAGYLFSAGQIAVEYLISGVYFKYDAANNSLEEIANLKDCNIVAFNSDSLIYFKNEKYYAYTDGVETYICDDEAVDKGSTHYSFVSIFFNADECIIVMNRGYSDYKKDYIKVVACDYSGKISGSFKFPEIAG